MRKAGIICGGYSSEYDISVLSATTIKNNFPSAYEAYLIFLRKEGWFIQLEDGSEAEIDSRDFSYSSQGEKLSIDFFIVYIHGDPGENGKIQAYLEILNKRYVNSGPLASQLSFDKWYCNQFLKAFGIKVADSVYLANPKDEVDTNSIIDQLGLPLFVKPCDSGSSYGIARVDDKNDLAGAVEAAFAEGETVIIESYLDGTEVTCGVYNTVNGIEALPLTEIETENAFFDYEAKYEGKSNEITPARISAEMTKKVQDLSKQIYQLLQLRSISRIDYMLVNNEPYVIEVNTTPGFSAESLVPQQIAESGKTITSFWKEILEFELS